MALVFVGTKPPQPPSLLEMVPPLYKFRSINESDFENCFTLKSLRESHVFFANMTTLNDPFEMGTYLNQVSDPETARNEFMNTDWSSSPIGRHLESLKKDVRREFLEMRWNDAEWREGFIEAWRKVDGFSDESKKFMSIFCASGTRDDGLLWAHYASGHRGIAIELDANADGVLRIARPVEYQEEFPIIDVLHDDAETKLRKGLLTKSRDWKYEQEFRALFPDLCEGLRHEVDPSVFVSISFGSKISDETREKVIEATRPLLSHVRFEQARLGKKTFSMTFESFSVTR